MNLTIMGESQFADIANLTRLIYEAKDRLEAAKSFNERIKIKFEIKQLTDERTRLSHAAA
jgi:hypothetical protein